MDSSAYIYIFMHLYIHITLIIKGKETMYLRGKGEAWKDSEWEII